MFVFVQSQFIFYIKLSKTDNFFQIFWLIFINITFKTAGVFFRVRDNFVPSVLKRI